MIRLIPFLMSLFLVVGCGGTPSDNPSIGTVTGKVIIDGKPASQVQVFFTPKDGGRTSEGITNSDGVYTLVYSSSTLGAKVGLHTVKIANVPPPADPNNPNAMPSEKDGNVPANYLNTMKEMRVESGKNEIDLTYP